MKPQVVARQNSTAIYAETVNVTPEIATQLLENNPNNRSISDPHVARLTRDMAEGRWEESGDTVKISPTGRLLDGQHRLWAVCQSGATVPMLFAYNVTEKAAAVVDSGRVRTVADMFAIQGEKYSKNLQAALVGVHFWEKKSLHRYGSSALRPTKTESHQLLKKYPNIRDSVKFGVRMVDVISPSMAALFHFTFSMKDEALCEWFFEALSTGINLDAEMAVYWLRKRLLEDRASRAKLGDILKVALVIKAWNFHRNNISCRSLRIGDEEKFPEIT